MNVQYPAIRGMAAFRSPEYRAWTAMRARCRNPKGKAFRRYGARGIKVCSRWDSFELFLADMGLRPSDAHSLDRKDNDGDYEPGNCRWATARQQQTNRSTNRKVEVEGETMCVSEAARAFGVKEDTIRQRASKGQRGSNLLASPKTGPNGGTIFEYRGRKAKLSALCLEAGIAVVTAGARLRKGWPLEKALAPIENLAEKCRRNGVKAGMVYNRLRRGWDLERALTEPQVPKRKD